MPLNDTFADHIGTLLLAVSWLEDQSAEDESKNLETLFADYLSVKLKIMLLHPFWRTLAPPTRDVIGAMWDELQ